jgi:hypothetical protein
MGTELVPETLYSKELTRLCAREDYIDDISLRMGTELVPETLYSNKLTRLCAREDFLPEDGDGASPRNVVFKRYDAAVRPRRLY